MRHKIARRGVTVYLKALEIQGFKSFPDKTVLSFGEDITAIVGPNGSGKSNISDAIRWVMGEQSSKSLRGAKMEDVIFGGTQKRPQVGFAEVSLIIDNAEKFLPMENTEVMVTRRYYRSGESEYYINKQSTRLKDVNELFMDTGLGREGYSIIGQGRIDEILSVKSTDRREIFEEAAGISRFRHRKDEAERKLAGTQENLLRLGDKIGELELQVEPLREQAERAKKYLILRDELRSLEVGIWKDSLEKLQENSLKILTDCEEASRRLEQSNRELEELYRQSEILSQSMRDQDVASERIRERIGAMDAETAEWESKIAVLTANMENNLANIRRMEQEVSQQEERSGGIGAQIRQRKDRMLQIESLRAQTEAQLEEIAQKSADLSRFAGDIAREIDALSVRQALINGELSDKKAEISSLAAAAQELYDRETEVQKELAQASEIHEQTSLAAKSCDDKLEKALESAKSIENAIAGYDINLKTRREKEEELAQKAMKLSMEQEAVRSRIAMLQEMEKEYEGFSKAVKTVMQETRRGMLKNIHGPVSSLLRTKDQYTVAIETALGAAMQNIVVDREEDGKAAILMLKKRDAGRATFLPLSAVRGRELDEKGVEAQPGFIGVANNLVEFAPQYDKLMKNLLGRVVIVEDMDCAIAIARKYAYRFRIVTLDGQVLNAGGSMTGGSVSKSAGVLSRANELKRITAQLDLLIEDQKKVNAQLQGARRQTEEMAFLRETALSEKREAEDCSLKLQGEKNHYYVLLQNYNLNRESYRQELDNIKKRLSENREKIDRIRDETAGLEQQSGALLLEIGGKSAGRTETEDKGSALSEEIARLKMELAGLEAEKAALSSGISELEDLHTAMTDDHASRMESIAKYREDNEAFSIEISDARKRLDRLKDQTESEQGALKAAVAARMELEARRTKLEKESQEKNRGILDMERECARLEQKKASAAMEEKQIVDKLWDTYELTRTTAAGFRLETGVTAANKRIGELKRAISTLGNPNIGAIDEFERVNSRYEYLTGQRDDVEKAKGELEQIISEITGEMKTIFEEQFKLINENFADTFVEIFGGGRASLELEDESDILNCGIEIHVQPPGKQLKTITLLSGGEKAFVAIALYFAILKVRPTPFCVLDEIDAALDERNVARFANYLRSLAGKTQFIVITHRRGTMEEADVLYGVTMQEQGVSRMLTLNLNDMVKQLNIS